MKSKNPILKIPVISMANRFVNKSGKIRSNYLEISRTIIIPENVLVTEETHAAQPATANIYG